MSVDGPKISSSLGPASGLSVHPRPARNVAGTHFINHRPPYPLSQVIIPPNNNPIPAAVTSPLSVSGVASPSGGGFVRRSAPEPNKRALYVGGLDPRVTEDVLIQIFETTGHVQSVKVIPDKNGNNYGFVEYDDPGAAERAMSTLNGRRVHQSEIRVNWAYQSNQSNKEDTSSHFHIFVGDLSNEVHDELLSQAFYAFGSVSEARVMWDMKTGRSRGYGFVAFRDRSEAEKALSTMDGEWLGSRAIRCNWANQKGQPSVSQQAAIAAIGMTPATPYGHHHFPTHGVQSYDTIVTQTPRWQTTVYAGNLTPYTTQNDIVPLFQNFGYVVETRFQTDRGFAFLKLDSHENAAMAICQLSGFNVNGRPLKCSWGKDRPPTGQFDGYSPQNSQSPQYPPHTSSAYFSQYGGPMISHLPPATTVGPNALSSHGPQSPALHSPSNRWQDSTPGFSLRAERGYASMPQTAGGYGIGNGPSTSGGWGVNSARSFSNVGIGFSAYQQ